MKRFQESSWVIKLFRYRWYIMRPFWFLKIVLSRSGIELGSTFRMKMSNAWKLTAGLAQSNMHWYWTEDEIQDHFKKKFRE